MLIQLHNRAISAIGPRTMASGKEFTDRRFGLRKRRPTGQHEFDQLCADLGIEHRLAPPMHPQTNGMVNRFNGRIEEVLQSHHFRSGEELETPGPHKADCSKSGCRSEPDQKTFRGTVFPAKARVGRAP